MNSLTGSLPASLEAGWVDRAARHLVFGRLDKVSSGQLTLAEGPPSNASRVFGADAAGETAAGKHHTGASAAGLHADVHVHNARFYRSIATRGGLGAAESLMRGEWCSSDLTTLVRLFIRNMHVADKLQSGAAAPFQLLARLGHMFRRNSKAGSRRNIEEHYDLSNEFFALFLDDTMQYSCAMFDGPQTSLYDASMLKLDRICRKLNLQPGDRLLEIGSGWGSLAMHAAVFYGCHVTTTTISREQHAAVQQKVAEAGLGSQITVLLSDYRELQGKYDKIVSIEMIEAVGHEYLDTFFQACASHLKHGGLMLLQAIVMNGQRHRRHLKSVDFIRKHIFPGGCLPSLESLQSSIVRSTRLQMLHYEDMTPHYARTLAMWRERFLSRLEEIKTLGFTQAFIRMWEYYLCYCEAGFAERQTGAGQMLLAAPGCTYDVFQNVACKNATPAETAAVLDNSEV